MLGVPVAPFFSLPSSMVVHGHLVGTNPFSVHPWFVPSTRKTHGHTDQQTDRRTDGPTHTLADKQTDTRRDEREDQKFGGDRERE